MPAPAPATTQGPRGNPAAPGPGPGKQAARLPPPVPKARFRLRHYGILASFFLFVVAPTVLASAYLFMIAKDQYVSTVGFAVRNESVNSPIGILSGLSSLGGSSSSDTDILYKFIQSQELVQLVNQQLDLKTMYSKPDFDPVFAFDPSGSIEDLTDYWQRMVRIFYDNGTGLIELRVHAFDPDDASKIAEAIFEESSLMINKLSDTAREDVTRYARQEVDRSSERLAKARVALTEFRSRTQIVDPTADVQGQMGLLNNLQQQLAAAMIELSVVRETAREGDPRIAQGERRISVIQGMIAEERRKLGVGTTGDAAGETDMSTLVGEFEKLSVEREFAEKAYVASLTALEAAEAEAQHKSRYLAAYSGPTRAERALYPRRYLLTTLVFGFALMIWAIGLMIYYSVRDRR